MAMAVTQPQSFTFETEHHVRDSFKILERMQKERVLCDVTLVAKNVHIPAHKNVLASCSPYFYSMFTNFQTIQDRIELDVNPQVLLAVINYMYTSKLTVDENNIMDLFAIAKMLVLNGIQVECSNILEGVMGPHNCFNIKRVAANYGNPTLLNSASSYIDDNFVDAVASEEFLSLTSDDLTELISKDSLKMSSEEKVYECVVRWINHNHKERRKYLRLLMGYVRLRFISKDYIRQHLVDNSFLRGDTYCKDLIIKALLEEDPTNDQKTKPRRYEEDPKILLVVGGYPHEAFNTLQYYNFEKKCWSTTLEMPFHLYDAGSVAVNQNVYVVGGWRNGKRTRTLSHYDIDTNIWDNSNDMTTTRATHGVGVLNNCIYAVGGFDGKDFLNSAEKFDLQTQRWSLIAPMIQKRRSLGVGVLNGILYAIGGENNSNSVLKSVECYDQRTDTWKELSSMNDCRKGVGVCTVDGKLYAIGGHNGKRYLSTVEEYRPETNSWTVITTMQVPRYCPGVVVVGNKIYITGGHNGNYILNSTEVYDKITNSWTILPESMNVARSRHVAVIVSKHN